jgi:hypothetical protein
VNKLLHVLIHQSWWALKKVYPEKTVYVKLLMQQAIKEETIV